MVREQYEVTWKDYYQLLGVRPDATLESIRRVWRRLSQVYHPDVAGDAAVDPERMRELNEAYEVLSDPDRRARYDQLYRARQSGFNSDSGKETWEEGASAWNDDDDKEWYRDPETERASGYSDAYSQEARAYGSSYEYNPEPVPILSFSFLRLLLYRFLDKICPNPDESQRIMPWPSWGWQRLFLMGSIPIGLLIFGMAVAAEAWPLIIFAFLLSSAGVYTGVTTRWMRTTHEAPLAARIAGGASITISGVSLALTVAYVVFVIVITVLMLIFIAAALRAMLAEAFRRYLR